MDSWNTEQLVADAKRYVWHPFTSMGEWFAPDQSDLYILAKDLTGRYLLLALTLVSHKVFEPCCGMIGAIELARDTRRAAQVCRVTREQGLLTRHIPNTITLLPPLIISSTQLDTTLTILNKTIQTVLTRKKQQFEIAPTIA